MTPITAVNLPWEEIRSFISDLGVVKGTFVVFFWVMHAALFTLYRGRLADRQSEINRLAVENREYRERFTALLDKQFKIPKSRASTPQPNKRLKRRS